MEFDQLIHSLESQLKSPLPGKDAHLMMSPQPVDMRRFEPKLPENFRKSAVLVLIYPEGNRAFFPLIKRPVYLGVHSGQVAFPGGKMDPEDVSLFDTALREAEEEVGIPREKVQILGTLSDLFIPTSNFLVSPIIGFTNSAPEWIPEEKEVSRIILTEVQQLLDPQIKKRQMLELHPNLRLDTPYFEIDGEMVWGATAMILSELIQLLSGTPR